MAKVPATELDKLKKRLYRKEAELEALELRSRAIVDNLAIGVSVYDKKARLVVWNQQFLDLYRLRTEDIRRGTTFRRVLELRVTANTHVGADAGGYVADRMSAVGEARRLGGTHRLNTGEVIQMTHQPLDDGGWVSTHRDITEVYNLQAELTHLAYHDPLTALPNRTQFYQRLGQAFARLAANGGSFAVLCLDLDGFKPINDTLGHAVGDDLLRQFGRRITAQLGPNDIAARMGGDEFAILLGSGTVASAMELAERIRSSLERPFECLGEVASVGAGIGVAVAPDHGTDLDQLLHSADLALYAAKRERKGAIRMFETALDAAASGRRNIESALRQALENGELHLFFQPIVNLEARRFAGFEALLRWEHPELGNIPPSTFIPVAEESGLIVPIGEWVLREALNEAAGWPDYIKVAVNVSALQLRRGNLVATVCNALAASGVASNRLELELTESLFMEQSAQNLETMRQLRDLGVRFALDDFGTGFSALGYLLAFPFDKIKIDGSFVRALDDSPEARTIVSAVADIGHRLGMETTAEGIESAEQLRNVHAVGYAEAQGYLISRPMSREAVRRLLDGAFDRMTDEPMAAALLTDDDIALQAAS
jgi:diguanylate cyclase (GGDEF)-like protein